MILFRRWHRSQQFPWNVWHRRGNCTTKSPSEGAPFKWSPPNGHDTGISLYNCVARANVPFIVRNPNCVTWYTCGPTVYDSAHIGHAVCYMKLDIIQRILRNHFQLNLVTAMNVTDIDDKIVRRSHERKIPWNELAKSYENEFWLDMERLGIRRADIVLHVSNSIDEIIEFVRILISKQAAYIGRDGSVYFRNVGVQGKLQNVNTDAKNSQHLDAVRESSADFALWKNAKPGEPSWNVPWQCATNADASTAGRPGWHTECSAMASKIFGSTVDVHAGGIDLRFPHHENEESQSVAYHNRSQWVNYWLHIGHLVTTDNVKMSKSLKNTISIDELLSQYTRDQFRMACMLTQYREHIEFGDAIMVAAAGTLKRFASFLDNTANYAKYKELQRRIHRVEWLQTEVDRVCVELDAALKDAFNTPYCIRLLAELISTFNLAMTSDSTAVGSRSESVDVEGRTSGLQVIQSAHNVVRRFMCTCGFADTIAPYESATVDASDGDKLNIAKMIDELIALRSDLRETAQQNKDKQLFEICTRMRVLLNGNGIEVKDLGVSTTWSFSDSLRTKNKLK